MSLCIYYLMNLYLIATIFVIAFSQHYVNFRDKVRVDSLILAPPSHFPPFSTSFQLPSSFRGKTYDYALSLEQLQIDYQSSSGPNQGKFSVYLTSTVTSSQIAISYDSDANKSKIKKLRVRCLMVLSSFQYIQIVRHQIYQPSPISMNSSQYIVNNIPILASNISCQVYTSLVGFSVKVNSQNNITLRTEASLVSSTELMIKIWNDLAHTMNVYRVNLDIIIFDDDWFMMDYGYKLTTDKAFNIPVSGDYGKYYQENYSLSDDQVFFGISGFQFENNNGITLEYGLDLYNNNKNLTFWKQNELKADVIYLIFSARVYCKSICIVKNPLRNQFTLTLDFQPKGLKLFNDVDWSTAFNFTSEDLQLINIECDYSRGKVRLSFQYGQQFSISEAQINVNVSTMSPFLKQIQPNSIQMLSAAQNNLSLYYYEDSTYIFSTAVRYFSILLVALSILLFVVGNLGAKLIALECIAVFQLTALLRFALKNMTPTFDELYPLSISLGWTPLSTSSLYYEQSVLPPNVKAVISSRNPMQSVNVFLLAFFIPLIVGIILKILAVTKYKTSKLFDKSWKYAFGSFTFYGLMFLGYGQLLILVLNLKYFQLSADFGVGISFGALYAIILICYIIASYKQSVWFGSFRNKFQRFTISQHYYTFQTIQRAVTSTVVIGLSPNKLVPVVIITPFVLQLFFLIKKKPYNVDGWKRPIFNKLIIIILCLVYFFAGIQDENSAVNLYCPFLILLLLSLVLVVSTYYAVKEMKYHIQDLKNKTELPSTEECNNYIMNEFEKKIIRAEDNPFKRLPADGDTIRLMRANWNWQVYPNLYSISILDAIRGQIPRVVQQQQGEPNLNLEHKQMAKQQMRKAFKQI